MTMSGYIVVGILLVLTIITRIILAITNNEEDLKGGCDAITGFLIILILVTL